MDNELENIDSTNDELEVIDSENNENEDAEDKVEYTDNEKKLYARATKAEAELKEQKAAPAPKPVVSEGNLSNSDLIAVMRAEVHEDDMERVERFAKGEGQSIKDALNNPEMKAILNLRGEQRETANATNVKGSRKSNAPQSDSVIIANAEKGKLPEDDAGIEALIAAKRKLK